MSKRKPTPAPCLPLQGDSAIPAKRLRQCSLCERKKLLAPGELMPDHYANQWMSRNCSGSGQPPREEN